MDNLQSSHDQKKEPQTELEEFKEFLGPIATRYSDAQLIQLRSDMHVAARLLLDLYLLKRNTRTKAPQPGPFDKYETEK